MSGVIGAQIKPLFLSRVSVEQDGIRNCSLTLCVAPGMPSGSL